MGGNGIYGTAMRAKSQIEIDMMIDGATDLATSTAMTAIVARKTMRNDTTNAGIDINTVPTVDTTTKSCMSTTDEARKIGGEVDHKIDLDPAHLDQAARFISVTIDHIT